jgi:4-hydroxy-tetrahydrodipicolinate synthase
VPESLYVGLPTPMDERGEVDGPALDLLTDYLLQRTIDGLALLTEAAEDSLLTAEERVQIVERVLARAKGKKATVVFVSPPSTKAAVDLARHAEAKGASAIGIAPLLAPGLDYRALYRHVDKIARAVSLPILLVVRPDNAFDVLAPEEMATLAKHERIAGAHLPQGSTDQIEAWARRTRAKQGPVLTGCALAFSGPQAAGATGVVCGLAILATEPSAEMIAKVLAKETERVRALEKKARPAIEMLGPPKAIEELDGMKKLAAKLAKRPLAGAMPPVVPFALIKEGLRLQGHKLKSFVRPPHEAVSPEQSERLKAVLKSSGMIS